jgi:hypothetical protein
VLARHAEEPITLHYTDEYAGHTGILLCWRMLASTQSSSRLRLIAKLRRAMVSQACSAVLCCAVVCCDVSPVSEKTEHLSKLLECVKWRVMGYKGDDADGQPLTHPVRLSHLCPQGRPMCTAARCWAYPRLLAGL